MRLTIKTGIVSTLLLLMYTLDSCLGPTSCPGVTLLKLDFPVLLLLGLTFVLF